MEFKLDATVEINPQMEFSGFTRRVRRMWSVAMMILH
jgi:hypothetical protein